LAVTTGAVMDQLPVGLPTRLCRSRLPNLVYTVSQKRIPDIIDYNSKQDKQILIIFGISISDTTGHQTTVEVSTSPNVCFCTT